MEIIFEVRDAEEGGYWARALGHAIFTEGDTWEELRANVLEAVAVHFEDAPERPRLAQFNNRPDAQFAQDGDAAWDLDGSFSDEVDLC